MTLNLAEMERRVHWDAIIAAIPTMKQEERGKALTQAQAEVTSLAVQVQEVTTFTQAQPTPDLQAMKKLGHLMRQLRSAEIFVERLNRSLSHTHKKTRALQQTKG